MRIGIDLGGTKIEALAMDDVGRELARHRIDTPRGDYEGTVAAIAGLVHKLERGDRADRHRRRGHSGQHSRLHRPDQER